MAGDDQEKTEEPTAKKLADAKNKGQMAQSQELSSFIMLISAASLLYVTTPTMGSQIAEMMTRHLTITREQIFDTAFMLEMVTDLLWEIFRVAGTLYAVMFVAAFISPLYMSGLNFTMYPMKPKFSKLNPIKGIKKIFGVQGLVNLLKALLKVFLVGFFLIVTLQGWIPKLLNLAQEPMRQAFETIGDFIFSFFFILAASMFIVVLIDVPYQKWNTKKQLKMSKQEIKDESKSSEGNPEIKGRQRQAQMAAAQRRMMNDVPEADVVITNPTHYAVALKYDEEGIGAPIVIAKGADLIAAQIRSRALGAGVLLVQAPPLTRAVYYHTEVGQQIPGGLYLAVAKVLAYVFQLRQAGTYGPRPTVPTDLPIPDELKS
ncbi:MAG: flagellar biosynthesis protein FlhB [Methylococcales bacterium]|jgi:flagellar biosynthesis protein FlhB|nr:flagellar biosynthesis protein FlhB [Methylococcales bacterium]MBT7445006.1 flagellar biosynthesis protein FlhB [Methylococcales bacterium]